MVKAIIDIDMETNKVLNIIKAKHNLKDKSQAINQMALEYKDFVLDEPSVKPSFIKEMKKVSKEKSIYIGTIEDLKKHLGL